MYGLDEELLEMVPKPVLAVLCLYPLTAEVSLLPSPTEFVKIIYVVSLDFYGHCCHGDTSFSP